MRISCLYWEQIRNLRELKVMSKLGRMGKTIKGDNTSKVKQRDGPWKGVRRRRWGTWVSEIRKPLTKERIWLGSFDAPEKAARAYDAALYCLRGSKGNFNFPDDERPNVPIEPLSPTTIKAIAARFATSSSSAAAAASSVSHPSPSPPPPTTTNANLPEVGDSGFMESDAFLMDFAFMESDIFFMDNFLLDEPVPPEPISIWTVLEEEFQDFDKPK